MGKQEQQEAQARDRAEQELPTTPHCQHWTKGPRHWRGVCWRAWRGGHARKASPEPRRQTAGEHALQGGVSRYQCMGTAMRGAAAAPAQEHGGWTGEPASVDGHASRTPRCRQGSAPLHGSCSRAGDPLQRAQRSQRALMVARTKAADRRQRSGSEIDRAGAAGPPESDRRERKRADLADVLGSAEVASQPGRYSKRRSIFATVPAVSTPLVRSTPPARRPEPIRAQPTVFYPPLPDQYPRTPTSTPLVSNCTVPCRVMVQSEYAYSSALLWADLA